MGLHFGPQSLSSTRAHISCFSTVAPLEMRFASLHAARRNVVKYRLLRTDYPPSRRSFTSTTPPHGQNQFLFPDGDTFDPRPLPNPRAKNVAVLGGGITGLTSAFDIARTIPDAKVTLYEQNTRLGGWLDSETVEVDGGKVLFEWGPRTLRPDIAHTGRATISLVGGGTDQHTFLSKG